MFRAKSSFGFVRGRVNRQVWWLWQAGLLGATMAIGAMIVLGQLSHYGWDVDRFLSSDLGSNRGLKIYWGTLIVLDALVTVWISAKRFHDRNRPGVIAALWLTVTIFSIASYFDDDPKAVLDWVALALHVALGIWFVIELGCMPGTVGPNEYGPDPLALKRLPAYPSHQALPAPLPQPFLGRPVASEDQPTRPQYR